MCAHTFHALCVFVCVACVGEQPLQLADAPVEAPPPVVEEKDFVLNDAEGGWADDSDSDGDMFAEDDDFLKATKVICFLCSAMMGVSLF